jgi:hypothetical protein
MSDDFSDLPDTANYVTYSAEQLQALIHEALRAQKADHDAQMSGMQSTLDALAKTISGTTPTFTPEHAGGIGLEVFPTWSQYEQEKAWLAAERTREPA